MTGPMCQTVTNDPAAASVVRDRLGTWLARVGWPRRDAEDLVLATSEAVSNAIEHAYPGTERCGLIVVNATHRGPDDDQYRIVVTVTDHGHWLPVKADPGYRGRGISLMRAITEWVGVNATACGTTVRILSRAVPAHAGQGSPG